MGEDQAEYLLKSEGAVGAFPGAEEQTIHLGEVSSVPGPQAVAEAENLSPPWNGGEGDRVYVIEDDPAAGGDGVRAALIGAKAR